MMIKMATTALIEARDDFGFRIAIVVVVPMINLRRRASFGCLFKLRLIYNTF